MKTYDIIYMDPPWYYGNTIKSSNGDQRSLEEFHYPTMKDDELAELPIYDMMNDDALAYIWVTSPILQRAIHLIERWGLHYSTIAFVWDKQTPLMGSYTMSQTEMVIVAKKGKIPSPRGARNIHQFYSEKRREHSRKPDEIRRRIEAMHPTQTKLEMFARMKPEGWDVFGNETDKFDIEITNKLF